LLAVYGVMVRFARIDVLTFQKHISKAKGGMAYVFLCSQCDLNVTRNTSQNSLDLPDAQAKRPTTPIRKGNLATLDGL